MIKVVFMHLEKTGGTTLHHLLSQCFEKKKICPARYPTLHEIATAELAKYELFSGHYPYDSLAHIPGEKVIVTLLRKPKDRLLSLYYFHRSHKWEYIEKQGLIKQLGPAKQFELYEYLCKQQAVLKNVVTNWIGGSQGTSEEKLSRAMSRLDNMAAVGIQEEMKKSVACIFNALNLPAPSEIPKLMAFDTLSDENNNIEKIEKQKITPEIEAKLAELTALDDKLYNYAIELFQRRIHAQSIVPRVPSVTLMPNVVHEINFKKLVYPSGITEVSGMSKCEVMGRWTDSQMAKFRFKQPLPNNITLDLVASAFGPNIGQPIIVRIGKQESAFVVKKAKLHKLYSLSFNEITAGTDTIEIIPPKPTSPKDMGLSDDERKLGVLLVSLKIKEQLQGLVKKQALEPIKEQAKESVIESVKEPIVESIKIQAEKSVIESVKEPIVEPIKIQAEESVIESVKESIVEPIKIQAEESVIESVKEPIVEPIKIQAEESIIKPAKEHVEEPIKEQN